MSFNMIEIARFYNSNANNYMAQRVRSLKSNGVLIDKDDKLQIEVLYKRTVYEVVKYLRDALPIGFIKTNGLFSINLEEMVKSLSDEARWFLAKPSINTSLAPLGDDVRAKLYFQNSVVFKATDMNKAKGLPLRYRKEKFNECFIGKNIFEVRAMLEALNILPLGSDLDTAILELEEKESIRQNYLESIIAKLLLSGEEEDIVRAYLFNHFANINFNFARFNNEPEEVYRKSM